MSQITLTKSGKFSIEEFYNDMYDFNATDDYSITFEDANIRIIGNLVTKLLVQYDYNNDIPILTITFSNGTTVTYNTMADITAVIPEGLTGIARITYKGESGDETNTYNQILMLNNTTMFLYRLNSKRNVLNKSLTFVASLEGDFRTGINIKNPVIAFENFSLENTFNYVYIPKLKRYYYVDSVELTTKNMTTLALSEDVLMSHKDLILSQNAFISRSADSTVYEMSLNDNRRVCGESNIYEYSEIDLSSIFSPEVSGQYTYEYKYVITVFRG